MYWDVIEHADPFTHFLKFNPALQQDTDVVIASLKSNPEVETLLSEEVAIHPLVLAHMKETAEAKRNREESDDDLGPTSFLKPAKVLLSADRGQLAEGQCP